MMIHDLLLAPFSDFQFMQRALAGCLALSLSAPVIGVFLMLRRMSLAGDAISHAILPGAAIGYLIAGLSLSAMTMGGLVAGIAVALLAGGVARNSVIKEDTSLATFYLISLSAGVLIISMRGSNVDLLHVLFGTVLALGDSLTSGVGADAATAYPAVLQELTGWQVVNGGVSGDTSAQALTRLPTLLEQHRFAAVANFRAGSACRGDGDFGHSAGYRLGAQLGVGDGGGEGEEKE